MSSRKYLLLYIALVVLFILSAARARASDITLSVDCIERPAESGATRVWVGITVSDDVTLNSSFTGVDSGEAGMYPSVGGVLPPELLAGTYARVFNIEFPAPGYSVQWDVWNEDVSESLTITADMTGPDCQTGTGQPDGGLDSVTVWDVSGDLFRWEVWDGYTWQRVEGITTPLERVGERSFTRLTLGGDNQNIGSDNYRAFAVEE